MCFLQCPPDTHSSCIDHHEFSILNRRCTSKVFVLTTASPRPRPAKQTIVFIHIYSNHAFSIPQKQTLCSLLVLTTRSPLPPKVCVGVCVCACARACVYVCVCVCVCVCTRTRARVHVSVWAHVHVYGCGCTRIAGVLMNGRSVFLVR